MDETVSAVVVSYADPAATRAAVQSLLGQSRPPLEVLVVDNDPAAPVADAIAGWGGDPRVKLVHAGENLGYTAACNRAAAVASGDWLFFLNPDARAEPDCISVLLGAANAESGVIGAQVLLPDGRTNAGDNPLHITGISWAGRYEEPREYGPPRAVAAVSGAALMARARAFSELGGMCQRFFLYYDDTDLCWRMHLGGWEVGFCPDAVVWHDYEFEKGVEKWYWLERNRIWSVLSNYSALTLLLLAPLLIGTELAVVSLAVRDRWIGSLLRAWRSTLRSLPELIRWRGAVQASRRRGDSDVLAHMTGRFETALLPSPAALRMNGLVMIYRQAVLRAMKPAGR